MAAIRDWTSTLWSASWNGFPFFIETDKENGGRDVITHEFPHRDDPFNEDIGAKTVYFEGAAYLASDTVDADSAAFLALSRVPGPGTLVLPTVGAVLARFLTCERAHARDRLGYMAFTVKFVREGASAPLISVPLLGRLVIAAADTAAAAIVGRFVQVAQLSGRQQYVIDALADGIATGAAALDTVRTTNPVAPAVSARVRDSVLAIIAAAPLIVQDDPAAVAAADVAAVQAATPAPDGTFTDPLAILAAALVATVRALADGMAPDTAAGAMLDYALAFEPLPVGPSYLSPGAKSAGENVIAADALVRGAAMIAWAEAMARRIYTSRPQGVTARADAAERFAIEMDRAGGADGYPLYVALSALRGALVDYLTRLINDLAPIVTVEVNAPLPSVVLAWRLYGDPSRGVDLALRNDVIDPLSMPLSILALSPTFPAPTGLPTAWPAP
jgi:hypothetical protein